MPASITIEVPMLPPQEFNPNWRGHWADRYRAGKVYQEATYYSAVDARNKAIMIEPFPKAELELICIFPERRGRDADNLLAKFKPGLDALVMAGLLIDDDAKHLTIGAISILVSKTQAPATIIQLRRRNE